MRQLRQPDPFAHMRQQLWVGRLHAVEHLFRPGRLCSQHHQELRRPVRHQYLRLELAVGWLQAQARRGLPVLCPDSVLHPQNPNQPPTRRARFAHVPPPFPILTDRRARPRIEHEQRPRRQPQARQVCV